MFISASLKNFGSRVGEFFGRKKKDVVKEIDETEAQGEHTVEEIAEKVAEVKEKVKQELSKLFTKNILFHL